MIKKRNPININIIFILPFFLLVVSCNQTIEENKYNGKWILQKQNYNEDIIFKNGNFTKNYSSGDLRVSSSGKFYLNRNEDRTGVTISLIPDKIISEDDIIFQECENLDIIKINEHNLIIQKPTQWIRDGKDKIIKTNEILIYKKTVK